MTLTLREFKDAVFGRAIHYLLTPHNLSMKQAEARAAKEIAAEYRIKAAREKKRAPVMSMPAPVHDDSGVESELVHAKDRLFAKLTSYFQRHDARKLAERKAKRAAKKSLPRVKLRTPASPDPTPEPLPDNVMHFPLVYSGVERSPQHIDESMFPPRYQDRTAANWRASIAANELKKGTKQ
jgi:hypothetical protein